MNNKEIIARIAIINEIFSSEEIEKMISAGCEIPLHTYRGWKDRGMIVKKGEQGIPCKLWKMKGKQKKEGGASEEKDSLYYLAKSFLYKLNQVERVKTETP